jgi:hypothetical protein
MTAFPDAWTEFSLVMITEKGESGVAFEALIEGFPAMDWGEKDIEGIPLVNGGRVVKRIPMTDESITFKAYPVSVDLDGTGFMQHFHPQSTDDTTDPIVVLNTNNRNLYKITILWCTTLPASAETVPAAGEPAMRIQIFNAYLTVCKPSFDEYIKSAEVTFKWPPFQKNATRNKIEESTDGSTVLDAVTAFT